MVQHLVQDDRVQDSTQCRTASDDAHGHGSLLVEVMTNNRCSWGVQKARGQASEDTLTQDELPVFVAETGQHLREDEREC